MPLARTARRLAGPIARLRLLRPLLALCRIADFTGRGVGPTLDILGGAGGGDPCERCGPAIGSRANRHTLSLYPRYKSRVLRER